MIDSSQMCNVFMQFLHWDYEDTIDLKQTRRRAYMR